MRALKLPLHGLSAEVLDRPKAALAADIAVSGVPPGDAVAEEEEPQPAAGDAEGQEQPDTAAPKASWRDAEVAMKLGRGQPQRLNLMNQQLRTSSRRQRQVDGRLMPPGTAALGPKCDGKGDDPLNMETLLILNHGVRKAKVMRGAGSHVKSKSDAVLQLLSFARAGSCSRPGLGGLRRGDVGLN